MLDGELTQLSVLVVGCQGVGGAEQALQQPRRGELLDRGDSGVETRPVAAELAVRVGPDPVQRHVAVDLADLGELGDLVVGQGGGVGADPDAHPCVAERAHDIEELWVDGGLAAGQRHPVHPAGRQPRDDLGGDIVVGHRLPLLGS